MCSEHGHTGGIPIASSDAARVPEEGGTPFINTFFTALSVVCTNFKNVNVPLMLHVASNQTQISLILFFFFFFFYHRYNTHSLKECSCVDR